MSARRTQTMLVRCEKAGIAAIREGKNLRRGCIVAVLVVAIAVASYTPQLMTGKGTFEEASAVCARNVSTREWNNKEVATDYAQVRMDKHDNVQDYRNEQSQYRRLYIGQGHKFNGAAAVFSLVSFLLWMFFTLRVDHFIDFIE